MSNDKESAAKLLRTITGGEFEVRVLSINKWNTQAGYFDQDHAAEAIQAAINLNQHKEFFGFYFTLNPINPAILSRRANRISKAGDLPLTTDADIVRRRSILVDCDPIRTAGVSSSDTEKASARTVIESVYDYLSGNGWQNPIFADSGNGYHLLYRIDEPNDDATTTKIKRVLLALASKFDTPEAKIDTSVFNASRICKLYGTIGRKGDSTPERPHRRAKAISIPDEWKPIPTELIEDIADEAPKEKPKAKRVAKRGQSSVESQARAYLKTVDPAISGQNGHDAAYRAACILIIDFDLSIDDARPLLQEYNDRCEPSWTDTELEHKLEAADSKPDERGRLIGQKVEPAKHANEFELFTLTPQQAAVDSPRLCDESNDDPLAELGLDLGDITATASDTDITSEWGVVDAPLVTSPIVKENPKPQLPSEPIRNFDEELIPDKVFVNRIPLPIVVIADRLLTKTGNWPKRQGETLFVQKFQAEGVQFIQNVDSFIGYLSERTGFTPEFANSSDGKSFHTKKETFEYLKRAAEEYLAIETNPHEPLIPGHYYACEIPQSGNGDRLRELIDFFSPETDVDRDLILAAFATLFWGGGAGTRPAFVITAEGRGFGKSKLAMAAATLVGGLMAVGANEDYSRVVTRLLSPAGMGIRLLLLDNVKSLKFSSADLESLITSQVISGHQMFTGEGQRPNNLTCFITLNGVSLSKDLAQRGIIIHLRKPEFSGTWEKRLFEFIETHRQKIIADILGFLRQPAGGVDGLKFSRWGRWQQDIVCRLPDPAEASAVIKEREVAADADSEEASLIEEHFAKCLDDIGYETGVDKIFIPSSLAFEWFKDATGDRSLTVTKVMTSLNQKIDEGQFKFLARPLTRTNGRGIEWVGADASGDKTRADILSQILLKKSNSFI